MTRRFEVLVAVFCLTVFFTTSQAAKFISAATEKYDVHTGLAAINLKKWGNGGIVRVDGLCPPAKCGNLEVNLQKANSLHFQIGVNFSARKLTVFSEEAEEKFSHSYDFPFTSDFRGPFMFLIKRELEAEAVAQWRIFLSGISAAGSKKIKGINYVFPISNPTRDLTSIDFEVKNTDKAMDINIYRYMVTEPTIQAFPSVPASQVMFGVYMGCYHNSHYDKGRPTNLYYGFAKSEINFIKLPRMTSPKTYPGIAETFPNLTNKLCMNACGRIGSEYAMTKAGKYCMCGDLNNKDSLTKIEEDRCNAVCQGDLKSATDMCGGTVTSDESVWKIRYTDEVAVEMKMKSPINLDYQMFKSVSEACLNDIEKARLPVKADCKGTCQLTVKDLRRQHNLDSRRALGWAHFIMDGITIEKCAIECAELQVPFFGIGMRRDYQSMKTKDVQTCFCGFSAYSKYGTADRLQCADKCQGDLTNTCKETRKKCCGGRTDGVISVYEIVYKSCPSYMKRRLTCTSYG